MALEYLTRFSGMVFGKPKGRDLRRNDQEGLIEMRLKFNMGCDYFQSHRVTHHHGSYWVGRSARDRERLSPKPWQAGFPRVSTTKGRRATDASSAMSLWTSSCEGAAPKFFRQPLPVRPDSILPPVTNGLPHWSGGPVLFLFKKDCPIMGSVALPHNKIISILHGHGTINRSERGTNGRDN